MRYWDASALVPLVIAEAESRRARSWLAEDPHVVTWCWSLVEIVGAVERRCREQKLSAHERRECLDAFRKLADSWDEVADLYATRNRALSLLARHPLRAADAAQLAAALLVAGDEPGALEFVCLDQGLAAAAELEGLRLIPI